MKFTYKTGMTEDQIRAEMARLDGLKVRKNCKPCLVNVLQYKRFLRKELKNLTERKIRP